MKKKILKISTVPESLNLFCEKQLRMLSEDFEVVAVSSPGPHLREIESREQVRVVEVPMERHISLLKDLISLFRLIALFYRERPYIVHSMTPKAGLLSMLAAWVTRVPVRIHTFTGLVFPSKTGLMQKLLMGMDRLTCFCATFINPEGQGVKRDMERFHITSKPLHIIANGNVRGVNMDFYKRTPEVVAKASELRDDHLLTFCFVGRLVGDKGINELIKAFARLYDSHPEVRLLLVGRLEPQLDPLQPETLKIMESHPAIHAVGQQSDVRPYLAASDAFVFPSYREGFPNVVLEAGALELPAIVTDINGSNEIILPGQNGVIVPSKNEEELYLKMKEWAEHPEQLTVMGAEARKMVAAKYDQKLIYAALRTKYKELVGDV